MKNGMWLTLLCGAVVVVAVRAEEGASPQPPEQEPVEQPAMDPERVGELAAKYRTTPERVTAMRQAEMGWGEIENALALATRTAEQSAGGESPLTLDQSLDAILAERAAGRGWGEIAGARDIRLGDVVSEAHHGERLEKPERMEKPEHRHGPGRADQGPAHDTGAGRDRSANSDRPDPADKAHGHDKKN